MKAVYETFAASVFCCARCGGDHVDLVDFYGVRPAHVSPLVPIPSGAYFGRCPVTGELIRNTVTDPNEEPPDPKESGPRSPLRGRMLGYIHRVEGKDRPDWKAVIRDFGARLHDDAEQWVTFCRAYREGFHGEDIWFIPKRDAPNVDGEWTERVARRSYLLRRALLQKP